MCKRFFIVNRFRQEDVEYVAKVHGISARAINLGNYKKAITILHQNATLKHVEYKSLDESSLQWLEDELQQHIKRLIDPRKLFFMALNLLHD